MTPPSPDLSPGDWFDLGYCAPRGIPLSIFRGRAPNPGEPHWLPEDTLAARWWQDGENHRCDGCGRDTRASMEKQNTFGYKVEILYCHGCTAIDAATRNKTGTADKDPLAGARYQFTHTPETN